MLLKKNSSRNLNSKDHVLKYAIILCLTKLCCKVILNSISQWEMTADLESELEYNSQVHLWEKCEPQTTQVSTPYLQILHIPPPPTAAGLEQVRKCLHHKISNGKSPDCLRRGAEFDFLKSNYHRIKLWFPCKLLIRLHRRFVGDFRGNSITDIMVP